MNLGELYDYIDYVSNKEKLGDAPKPDSYNILLKNNYLQVFGDTFADFIKALQAAGESDYAAILTNSHPLKRFEKTVSLTVANTDTELTKPDDYKRYLSFSGDTGNGTQRKIEILTAVNFTSKATNVLSAPFLEYPIAQEMQASFKYIPTSMKKFVLTYLRTPNEPYFDYCYDSSDNLVFMPEGSRIVNNTGTNAFQLIDKDGNLLQNDVQPLESVLNFPYSSKTVEIDWDQEHLTLITKRLFKDIFTRSREIGSNKTQ